MLPLGHYVLHMYVHSFRPDGPEADAQFSPCPIDEVVATIRKERPSAVCMPHVETSVNTSVDLFVHGNI